MEKYISLNAIVAEIKRRISEVSQLEKASYEVGLFDAYKNILSFLNTLEVKEVDLDEEFDRYCDNLYLIDLENEPYAELFECAKHFFELGLKAQKGE